jgi:hypothetical protein
MTPSPVADVSLPREMWGATGRRSAATCCKKKVRQVTHSVPVPVPADIYVKDLKTLLSVLPFPLLSIVWVGEV